MARPLRIQYENTYYHVTCRGNAQARIFLKVVKGSGGFYNSMSGFGGFNIYGVTSVCHQMTNQAILQAGYSLTVKGSMAGWASYLSGSIYGPYGSAEPGLSYFEAEKNRER